MAYTVTPYGAGMIGNDSWVADQRPKDYREALLFLRPNGTAPLFALTSRIASERTTDPEFNWWEKNLPKQGGPVTKVYVDEAMGTAYSSGADYSAGSAVFVNVAAAVAKEFRPGHMVLLRDNSDITNDVRARVTAVSVNGTSSRISCILLEADGTGTTDLSDCDYISVIGNMNAEGALIPEALSYQPTKYRNYTQIFHTPLSITRTAMKTRLRTGDALKEMRREALELHGMEIEKSLLYGIASEDTDPLTGQPIRSTMGMINYIETYSSETCFNWSTATGASSWPSNVAVDWIDSCMEQIFRYGSRERTVYCGSGALLGIQKIARHVGTMQMEAGVTSIGTKVTKLLSPFGNLDLFVHPLFSFNSADLYRMVIFDPSNLKERYIDKTYLKKDDGLRKGGATAIDGIKDEYLTEMGLEFHHPPTFAIMDNVGVSV